MVIPQQVRRVNPMALAEVSGATKIRRFAAPTPPVVRPFLLTHQLRGSCPCGCGACGVNGGMAIPPDYGRLRGMRGLGQPGSTYIGDPGTFDMNNLQVPSAGSGNISVLQTMAVGANFVPGVGQIASVVLSTFNQFLNQFEAWFHIGAGRREANIIVPVQNQYVNQTLGNVTQQILTGMTPSVAQLQQFYQQVWSGAVAFQEFVLLRNFTDRRASGQALNTVMPYVDGSCGYAVPIGFTATPSQWNCPTIASPTWGEGTIGGPGTNGMLGAISRAIVNAGGTVPTFPDLHMAANQGIKPSQIVTNPTGFLGLPATIMGMSTPLVLFGVAALFLYERGTI